MEAFASRKAVITCRDSGGPAELVQPARHLPVELLEQDLHRPADRFRLLAEEASLVDIALELLHGMDADGRILVVGHEPDFSRTVHDLTGAEIDFKKGGIAAVRTDGPAAELRVLLRPREIELIAG